MFCKPKRALKGASRLRTFAAVWAAIQLPRPCSSFGASLAPWKLGAALLMLTRCPQFLGHPWHACQSPTAGLALSFPIFAVEASQHGAFSARTKGQAKSDLAPHGSFARHLPIVCPFGHVVLLWIPSKHVDGYPQENKSALHMW